MKTLWMYAAVAVGAWLLQQSLTPYLPGFSYFNVLWVVLMTYAFRHPLKDSGVLAVLLGVFLDFMGTSQVFLFGWIFFVLIALLRSFISKMFVETFWAKALWIGIFTALGIVLEWLGLELMGDAVGRRWLLFSELLPRVLGNTALMLVLGPYLSKLGRPKRKLRHAF